MVVFFWFPLKTAQKTNSRTKGHTQLGWVGWGNNTKSLLGDLNGLEQMGLNWQDPLAQCHLKTSFLGAICLNSLLLADLEGVHVNG